MATPIFSRNRRRGEDAKPFSGARRTRGSYKPRAGSTRRRPSRGGLPTDPAMGRQLRSGRAAGLAQDQIRATGRATPQTLGAALDAGEPRSASERGEDRLSRRSTIQQSGRVKDSRGVPMTEAQRDQRGLYVASKQRERLAGRRRARARMPDPAGSMSVQFAGKPERTLSGASAKLGGGIVTGQGAEDIGKFKENVRQDAFKQRFPGELTQDTLANESAGMAPDPAYSNAVRGLLGQYDQIPQDVTSDMRAKFQTMDPVPNPTQAGVDASIGRISQRGAQVTPQYDPAGQFANQADFNRATGHIPEVPAASVIPNVDAYQRTQQRGFYPVQDALQPAAPPAPVVAQPVVPPLYTDPNAPLPMTPQQQMAYDLNQAQIANLNSQTQSQNTATGITAQAQGYRPPVAPGQVAPPVAQSFPGTVAEIAEADRMIQSSGLQGGIVERSTIRNTESRTADAVRTDAMLDNIQSMLLSATSPAVKRAIARQLQSLPLYAEVSSPQPVGAGSPIEDNANMFPSANSRLIAQQGRMSNIKSMIDHFAGQ